MLRSVKKPESGEKTRNKRSGLLLSYGILSKAVLLLVALPVGYALFLWSVPLSGLAYLSSATVQTYLFSPAFLLWALAMVLLAAVLVVWEAGAWEAYHRGDAISPGRLYALGFQGVRRLFQKKGLVLLWAVLSFGFSLAPGSLVGLTFCALPDFLPLLPGGLVWRPLLLAGALLLLLGSGWAGLAVGRKAGLVEKGPGRGRLFLRLLARQGLLLVAGFAVMALIWGLAALWVPQGPLRRAQVLACLSAGLLLLVLLLGCTGLSVTLYEGTKKGETVITASPPGKVCIFLSRLLPVGVFAFALCLFALDHTRVLPRLFSMPAITAHRGNSVAAPENTMPALEQAIADGAQWAEIDVHMTKDGKVVLLHSSNMVFALGEHRMIWDTTYEELLTLDAGSWHDPAFAGTPFLSLEDALALSKGRLKLNIELKVTGHEQNLAQEVIREVRKAGMEKSCVISAQDLEALKACEALAPELETYAIVTEPAEIASISHADGLSVEAGFVTHDLLYQLRKAEKKLLVWTVNDQPLAASLFWTGIDALVTDETIASTETFSSLLLGDWVKYLAVSPA